MRLDIYASICIKKLSYVESLYQTLFDIYQDTLIRRVSDIETLVSIYMYRLNIYVRDSIFM